MKIPVEWPEADMFLVDKSAGRNFYREKQAAVKSGDGRKPYDNRGRASERASGRPSVSRPPSRDNNRKAKPETGNRSNYRGGRPSTKSSGTGSGAGNIKNLPGGTRSAKTVANSSYAKNKNQTGSNPNNKKRPNGNNNVGADRNTTVKLTRTSTEAEKLAYYKSKYGENFKLKSSEPAKKTDSKKKEGFLKKLFKGKNKK